MAGMLDLTDFLELVVDTLDDGLLVGSGRLSA